jgi:hypothetical protein
VSGKPLADVAEEADRVLTMAARAGATVRLLGGLAIAKHMHTEVPSALRRSYPDIDLAVRRGDDRSLRGALQTGGYVPNAAFNSLRGGRRLLYYDEANGRQVDVFVGAFRMCHTLELDDRLTLDPATLSPADLLLTKLQVVEINRKDQTDALALLLCHELAPEREGDVIGIDRLTAVAARDWGWFTTVADNLVELREVAGELPDDGGVRDRARERIDRIARALADAPKSLGWKARAKVGRRVVWYEVPEEVRHGG